MTSNWPLLPDPLADLWMFLAVSGSADMPWTTAASGGLLAVAVLLHAYGFFPGIRAAMVGGWLLHALLLHIMSGRASLREA